ncbi:hypothetical protein EOD39_0165 [Acipenser ruthenus]|uniref:Uncharacterized protein n=1 Tax=Acipenser ruthenus TaxID=7906 RepID=A0A444UH07_ACIRT|nr:hypothetical protein EOD39_0165 [Acipenser ruthenus]
MRLLPPLQQQPESAVTRELLNGMEPPTPQPRLKRLSHGSSQNEATENDESFVQAEAEAAVMVVAVLGRGEESSAAEGERTAEELAAVDGGADSEDGAEEMEGELSDASLISDIPDSQP